MTSQGFTIVEVLIVLAIVGVILVILLLAIPAAQREQRNVGRRSTVDATASQIVQYQADNQNSIPRTAAEGATFVANYMSKYQSIYTFGFRKNDAPHNYIPPYDTVAIQYGHWCVSGHGGAEASGDPISTAPGGDNNNRYYAVWTQLEDNIIFCVDNGDK